MASRQPPVIVREGHRPAHRPVNNRLHSDLRTKSRLAICVLNWLEASQPLEGIVFQRNYRLGLPEPVIVQTLKQPYGDTQICTSSSRLPTPCNFQEGHTLQCLLQKWPLGTYGQRKTPPDSKASDYKDNVRRDPSRGEIQGLPDGPTMESAPLLRESACIISAQKASSHCC